MTFVFPLGNLRFTHEDCLIYNKGVRKLVFLATAVIYVCIRIFLLVRTLYYICRYAFTYIIFIMLFIIVLYVTFVFPLGNLRFTHEDCLIYNKGVRKLVFLATAVIYVCIRISLLVRTLYHICRCVCQEVE